jgi:hypothetical protein
VERFTCFVAIRLHESKTKPWTEKVQEVKEMRSIALLIAISLLVWTPVQAQEQAVLQDDYLIVPGERIGIYRLGATSASFEESWGASLLPGWEGHVFAVKPFGFGAAFCDDLAVKIFIYSAAHPFYPERDALASRYSTKEGIRLGSLAENVQRIYGVPERSSRVFLVSMDYFSIGLRILKRRDVEGNDKVVQIDVLPRGMKWDERGRPSCP